MPKHYFTSLASRPMKLSGKDFRFAICSIAGGRASGVYEATDPAEIAILDAAVSGRRGVQEIGADEFETLKKKASQTRQSVSSNGSKPPRVVLIPLLPEIAIEGKGSAPSAASEAGKSRNGEDNLLAQPSISSLIRVKKVNPPRPFAASEQKTRKAADRADRAKVRVARKNEA